MDSQRHNKAVRDAVARKAAATETLLSSIRNLKNGVAQDLIEALSSRAPLRLKAMLDAHKDGTWLDIVMYVDDGYAVDALRSLEAVAVLAHPRGAILPLRGEPGLAGSLELPPLGGAPSRSSSRISISSSSSAVAS